MSRDGFKLAKSFGVSAVTRVSGYFENLWKPRIVEVETVYLMQVEGGAVYTELSKGFCVGNKVVKLWLSDSDFVRVSHKRYFISLWILGSDVAGHDKTCWRFSKGEVAETTAWGSTSTLSY